MLSFEAVAGVLAVALAGYLLLALLNPERFQ
jgi:K+-transporting ATPase KdpF subunit